VRNTPTFRILAILLSVPLAIGCSPRKDSGDPQKGRNPSQTEIGRIEFSGLSTPESVLHDPQSDVYLVSNINGSPFGEGGKGFISRIGPEAEIQGLKWIQGGLGEVKLSAPKGMALVGDVLYVTDVTAVRKFDRKTGKPLGEIAIEGASFLNDLAAAPDGTVYVSDTGLGKGFASTGTDAVYAIGASGEVKALAKGKELGQPNGLLAEGDSVLMVGWESGALSRVGRDGKITEIAKLPKNQLDGLVRDSKGDYLVSSWAGSCVYRVTPDGKVSTAVPDLNAPADLGYDEKRGRLLIPFFNENKVLVLSP